MRSDKSGKYKIDTFSDDIFRVIWIGEKRNDKGYG